MAGGKPGADQTVSCADIDGKFTTSGGVAKLCVSSVEREPLALTILLSDLYKPGQSQSRSITLFLKQPWYHSLQSVVTKNTLFVLKNIKCLCRNNARTDHKFELHLDDSPESKKAEIVVLQARERIMGVQGTTLTFADAKKALSANVKVKVPVQGMYVYTPLAEIRPSSEGVNIYGVVVNYTFPKKTKTGDQHISVHVSDISQPDRSTVVNCFKDDVKSLPQIMRIGDIFRAHRCRAQSYAGRLTLTLPKKMGSHILIDGCEGHMTAPYHRSTTNSQPPDVELVAALRKWAANVELPIINPEYKDSRGGLDQFTKKGPKIELICKIIGITKPRGNNPRYLVVWDATDVMLEESVVQIEREDCIMLEDDEGPEIGGYFPVQVEEKILSQLTIIPGDWVHLQNVSIQCTARGQEYFGYAEDARVLCASLLDCQKVEKKCAMRMKKELEDVESENKLSRSCITKDLNINFFHSIVSMVSEFSPVPGNFQLRAKITRVEPTDPKEWCKLYCEKCMSTQTADKKTLRCTECKRKKKLKWEFYLILTLADETGVQDVIVSRDEANFFLQAKPCNLEDKENEEMVQNFEKIVDIITQPNSWGYFFVRSVMTQGEEEEDEAPEYFLENTQLDFQA